MATRKYGAHINLQGNEIQNGVDQNLSTAPSNPKEGQFYWDTINKKDMIYNGSAWVDRTNQGKIYTAGTGIAISNSNEISVTSPTLVNQATGDYSIALGQPSSSDTSITINTDYEGGAGDYSIQIGYTGSAGESSVSVGLSADTNDNGVAIGSQAEANSDYSTALGYGATVDSNADKSIQIGEGYNTTAYSLSIGFGNDQNNVALNYTLLDGTTGKIPNARLTLDSSPTSASTNAVTSGGVYTAIANALTGALIYKGTWTATSQTDYSSITLPVKKGYMYAVSGTATIGGVEWNSGDYLVINKDIASGGTITSSDVDKIDNTEGSDIVRLNATQTLTNKTIDADDNTISDLTASNLKSGVLLTSVRASGSASDTSWVSEKAVASLVEGKKATFTNPALTASGGQVTWTITTSLAPDCIVAIRETSGGAEVYTDVTYGSGSITVKMNSTSDISAGVYTAVVLG